MKAAFQKDFDHEQDTTRYKYIDIVNGRLTKIKYCTSCEIYRPPRTVHCGYCDCCIERLDHHCPWLGTCVGKRNYKYFITFVTLLAYMIIQVVSVSLLHIIDSDFNTCETVDGIKECRLSS